MENSYLNRYRRDTNDIYTIIAAALVIGKYGDFIYSELRLGIVNFNGIVIPYIFITIY